MARQLIRRGDSVALAARRVERLDELAAHVTGGRVSVHPLDVTDFPAVAGVMDEADRTHGGLEVVVVNAGRGGGARLGTGRFPENRLVVDTNFTGALAQIEAALDLFRRRGRGHLVLVSSLAATRGLPGSAAVYSATKVGLAWLGESLRAELGGSGIDVTTLRPGYIRTELNERADFRYMTELGPGVEAMIAAMDRKADDVVVPAWPWRPLGWLLRLAPDVLIRRFM